MNWRAIRNRSGILLLSSLLVAAGPMSGREHPQLLFRYAGGTEDVTWNCRGRVQLSTDTLTFGCPQHTVAIPYHSITLMQYRPDVAEKVHKMNLNWKVKPPRGGGRKNRYFTIIYDRDGSPNVIVLEASPEVMRPYLAEIDVKSGKRVEVRGYEKYE
jgi:hypothetical protein